MSNDRLRQNRNGLMFKGFCIRFRFAGVVGLLGVFRKGELMRKE